MKVQSAAAQESMIDLSIIIDCFARNRLPIRVSGLIMSDIDLETFRFVVQLQLNADSITCVWNIDKIKTKRYLS